MELKRIGSETKAFTLVDLFAGAGGLSLGFVEAGFRPIAAYECWAPAVKTYRENIGNHVVMGEVSDNSELPPCDVVAGGPPCQGFSSAGARRKGDHRNTLVRIYANLIARHLPTAFVFENVEGFVTNDDGSFLFDLLDPLVAAGYRIHLCKVNAANYGVPQHRKRVIAVGGLGWEPTFPSPTHSAWGAPGAEVFPGLPPAPTLDEAFAGLPPASCSGDESGLDHQCPPVSEEDLQRAKLLRPGQRMRDLPEQMWHGSYRRRAFRRVMDGMPTEKRGGAPSGVRRLKGDEPCKAITGGVQNEFLHPREHRPLTVREAARVQTFPDDFRFYGRRPDRMQLIGNAVPPRLAHAIAATLMRDLCSHPKTGTGRGSLLTFRPTPANGMSPVLQRVSRAVSRRYPNETYGGLFDDATVKG